MNKICCSADHLLHPLHFTFKGKKHSVHHKASLIIQSVAAGIFTFGIGGLFLFYHCAAVQKQKQIKKLQKKQKVFVKKKTHSKPTVYTLLKQFDPYTYKFEDLDTIKLQQCKVEFKKLTEETTVDKIQKIIPGLELAEGAGGQDRYTNNKPWKHTQVQLPSVSFLQNTYINASWVNMPGQRKIIAAQGPNYQTLISFWHMVYSHDVNIVVMLSAGINYWRDASLGELPYSLQALHEYCTVLPSGYHLIERKLQLCFAGSPPKIVYHFQIPDWPDFGILDDPNTLLAALHLIEKKAKEELPWAIHCSAGLGRTGTLLTIRHLLANSSSNINAIRTIAEMRLLRPNLVQTPEQLEMIYRTLAAAPSLKWKAQKTPEAELCIDFENDSPRMGRKTIMRGLTDGDGQEIKINPDEALLKCRCFYGNKAFVKKLNIKKLFLPAFLFENRVEGDVLEFQFKGEKFRLILSQTNNSFDSNNLPFEKYLPRIKAKQFSHLDPYSGYRTSPSNRIYQLAASDDGIILQRSEEQELKELEAPEFIQSEVEIDDDFLVLKTLLPSAELDEIDIILTKEQIIIYAKMKDVTVEVDESNGSSIELHLQNEYFSSIVWPIYTEMPFTEFIESFEEAVVQFVKGKLILNIDIKE